MGLFSPDPPDPPPIQPDPEPPKKGKNKKAQAAGQKARRDARRKGRSQTILTDPGKDTEALGRSRKRKSKATKLGGA